MGNKRHHQPGYTPAPLRPWYLLSVLIYTCFLLSLLEYSLHTIPQIDTPQTSPSKYLDSPSYFFGGDINPLESPRRAEQGAPFPNSTAGFPNTTIPEHDNSTGSTGIPTRPSEIQLHLDPGAYAQLDPDYAVLHYRWNFVWVHDPRFGGRYVLPPPLGLDIRRHCTFYSAHIFPTGDEQDCRALFLTEGRTIHLVWGPWSAVDLDTPKGRQCFEEGQLIHTKIFRIPDLPSWKSDRKVVLPGPVEQEDIDDHGCWRDEELAGTTFEYPERAETWPSNFPVYPPPTAVTTSAKQSVATTITTSRPATTSIVTTTAVGQDGNPTVTVFTTTVPGQVITITVDGTRAAALLASDDPSSSGGITVNGTVLTLTDSLGRPTATVTSLLLPDGPGKTPYYHDSLQTMTTTLTDSAGHPTATQTITSNTVGRVNGAAVSPLSTTLRTMYDAAGIAVSTQTQYIIPGPPIPSSPPASNNNPSTPFYNPLDGTLPPNAVPVKPLSGSAYFLGSFAPTVLTTVLSLLTQIFNSSMRAMVPFLALLSGGSSSGGGVSAEDSLLLPLEGNNILRIDQTLRLAWRLKEPLLPLGHALQVLGMVLVALSSGAVGMALQGSCEKTSFTGCYLSLAVVRGPARAAEGILVGMLVIWVAIIWRVFVLVRRRSRVDDDGRKKKWSWSLLPTDGNPTSILGAAAMLLLVAAGDCSSSMGLREVLVAAGGTSSKAIITEKEMSGWFKGYRFAMNTRGQVVMLLSSQVEQQEQQQQQQQQQQQADRDASTTLGRGGGSLRRRCCGDLHSRRRRRTRTLLGHGVKVLFLAVLASLLAVISYYGSTNLLSSLSNPLEQFMDSQTIGVSFLFAGAGGMVDWFWSGFFSRTEQMEPYRCLSQRARSDAARRRSNMIRPRSSSIFSGLFSAIANRNTYLGAVAFAGLLSKFLPVLLSNIPFRLTLTWTTYIICTWASVSILSIMILVMLSSSWIKRPENMPVDPGTIAGRMYYVCDSWITEDLNAGMRDPGGGNTIGVLRGSWMDKNIPKKGVYYSLGKVVGYDGGKPRKRQESMIARLLMALVGGLAVVVPVLIMVLHPTKLTAILTTSCFVIAVAVGLAVLMVESQPKDVIGFTAAYAAVLVVFVGAALGPDAYQS
ncbi:hypothetical protein B0H66DRAFT_624787 [Apodospora peruviana]|uniref:DUF6594 domain-containing protein n=1 Tax=Apodospora peruviana TaxID=516989 RepID=A0AAE0I1P8_9PEZI|nr:hypothetical protein B0H66DRAFT_624787 [Apodospora peruviana]